MLLLCLRWFVVVFNRCLNRVCAALMASSWVRTACWREAPLLWGVNAAAYGLGWSEETVRFCGPVCCVASWS